MLMSLSTTGLAKYGLDTAAGRARNATCGTELSKAKQFWNKTKIVSGKEINKKEWTGEMNGLKHNQLHCITLPHEGKALTSYMHAGLTAHITL